MFASTTLRALACAAVLSTLATAGQAQTVEDRTQDKVAFPAFKIMGNLYYVGTGTLNSYLITTPAGHILINTNFEDTVPLLRASIEKLGFKLTDIKILLGSHAHGDHMQADAMVKELTGGATVMAMEQDVPALKNMTPGNKPHPIDRVLKDGEQVSLGGMSLTAHFTPGHTRGCTTWTFQVTDGGKAHNVIIVCGGLQDDAKLVGNTNNPTLADDWAYTVKKWRTFSPDVFLGSHSWFFDLAGKHAKMGAATNPYIDPAGFKKYVDDTEKLYNKLLSEQKGSK
ncbi:MAG: subclass B3 metallo-beta-lactamase [Vicinamibacterales bacterium]